MNPVVIIGAGPYGLSTAAHLQARGLPVRIIGEPMSTWRDNMPTGMILKSVPTASSISAPKTGHTLQDFCDAMGEERLDSEHQVVPIDTFLRYGTWYADSLVPDAEAGRVRSVSRDADEFRVRLDSGEEIRSRAVIVATGLPAFAHLPSEFRQTGEATPSGAVSHSSQHTTLDGYAGQDVVVVGAGQSALESAALLHEGGASVRIVSRGGSLRFGEPPTDGRHWQPLTPLGRQWSLFAFSEYASAFRLLPERTRLYLVRKVLGPAGGWWLKERVVGRIPALLSSRVTAVRLDGGRPVLTCVRQSGATYDVRTDHVVAATGFRVDVDKLDFLAQDLRDGLRRTGGSPLLDAGLQSSVPGLYFTGIAAAATYGPLLRFVAGTDFAAKQVAAHLAAHT